MNIIEKTQNIVDTFTNGSFEVPGFKYKHQRFKFLHIAYLYLHSVNWQTPDLLDPSNKNVQIPVYLHHLNKINEQTRIDFKELGFYIGHNSALAEFAMKAVNRAVLTDHNDWTEIQERVIDDANWYGDGFKKVWEIDGQQKHKHIDPWNLMWDLWDFENSPKVERIQKTVQEIIDNPRYKHSDYYKNVYDDPNEYIDLFQYVDKDTFAVVDLANEIVLFEGKRPEKLYYVKYSHEYRRGAPDAPGIGIFEKLFNAIITNKTARERLEEVENIVSKLIFTKVKEKNDKLANKKYTKIKTGMVIPVSSPEHIIKPVELGGISQINDLQARINETSQLMREIAHTPEVLAGDAKELGANMSGIAIQTLAEYASSVHKDVKKRYARKVEWEYKNYIAPYILSVFDSKQDLRNHLTSIEMQVIERHAVNFYLVKRKILAEIEGRPFDVVTEKEKIQNQVKRAGIITGDLLEQLKKDIGGIRIVVSGEKASKSARAEFYNQIRQEYFANPQLFRDPGYIALLKKQAKIYNIDELEIDELLNQMQGVKV